MHSQWQRSAPARQARENHWWPVSRPARLMVMLGGSCGTSDGASSPQSLTQAFTAASMSPFAFADTSTGNRSGDVFQSLSCSVKVIAGFVTRYAGGDQQQNYRRAQDRARCDSHETCGSMCSRSCTIMSQHVWHRTWPVFRVRGFNPSTWLTTCTAAGTQ